MAKQTNNRNNGTAVPKQVSTQFLAEQFVSLNGSGSVQPAPGGSGAGTIKGVSNETVLPSDNNYAVAGALINISKPVNNELDFDAPVILSTKFVYGTLSGTFTQGETITGGTSGAKGIVSVDNKSTTMNVSVISGTFVAGETITGGTSSATAVITTSTPYTTVVYGQRVNVSVADARGVDITSSAVLNYNTLSGTFAAEETITGGSSGATAVIVKDTKGVSMVIQLQSGTFTIGETITGGTSSATAKVGVVTSGGVDLEVTQVVSSSEVHVKIL